MNAKQWMEYCNKCLNKKLFNRKGSFKKKFRPLLELINWHLRHLIDSNSLDDFLKEDIESLWLMFGGDKYVEK